MTSLEYESIPPEIFADVSHGWPFIARIMGVDALPKPTTSTVGNAEVPAVFELFVGDGEWFAVLMFRARDGAVFLDSVFGLHVEADQALANALSIRPLHWWKRYALREALLSSIGEQFSGIGENADPATQEKLAFFREQAQAYSDLSNHPVTRHRGRVTDSKLLEVARVYRQALSEGKGPTRAVESHFNVSYSTAARWVGMARKIKGGLGPSLGFKAGEQTDGK